MALGQMSRPLASQYEAYVHPQTHQLEIHPDTPALACHYLLCSGFPFSR